jgi:hypothetical protein
MLTTLFSYQKQLFSPYSTSRCMYVLHTLQNSIQFSNYSEKKVFPFVFLLNKYLIVVSPEIREKSCAHFFPNVSWRGIPFVSRVHRGPFKGFSLFTYFHHSNILFWTKNPRLSRKQKTTGTILKVRKFVLVIALAVPFHFLISIEILLLRWPHWNLNFFSEGNGYWCALPTTLFSPHVQNVDLKMSKFKL